MVESGVDADVQRWAARRDGNVTWGLRMPALAGGALLPMVLPIWLYVSADRRGDAYVANGAAAAGQAVVLAYVTNTLLKALTGRVPPDNEMSLDVDARARRFQFGFMRGGVFNGWPSGHSMVNMAMAASFANYFHDVAWVPIVAYSWAAYVMAAVVVGGQVHWLSEAVAGGAMGWAIGRTVGRGFAAGPQDLTTGVQVLPAAMPGGGGIVVSVPLERR